MEHEARVLRKEDGTMQEIDMTARQEKEKVNKSQRNK
jgi:hypothetical protein